MARGRFVGAKFAVRKILVKLGNIVGLINRGVFLLICGSPIVGVTTGKAAYSGPLLCHKLPDTSLDETLRGVKIEIPPEGILQVIQMQKLHTSPADAVSFYAGQRHAVHKLTDPQRGIAAKLQDAGIYSFLSANGRILNIRSESNHWAEKQVRLPVALESRDPYSNYTLDRRWLLGMVQSEGYASRLLIGERAGEIGISNYRELEIEEVLSGIQIAKENYVRASFKSFKTAGELALLGLDLQGELASKHIFVLVHLPRLLQLQELDTTSNANSIYRRLKQHTESHGKREDIPFVQAGDTYILGTGFEDFNAVQRTPTHFPRGITFIRHAFSKKEIMFQISLNGNMASWSVRQLLQAPTISDPDRVIVVAYNSSTKKLLLSPLLPNAFERKVTPSSKKGKGRLNTPSMQIKADYVQREMRMAVVDEMDMPKGAVAINDNIFVFTEKYLFRTDFQFSTAKSAYYNIPHVVHIEVSEEVGRPKVYRIHSRIEFGKIKVQTLEEDEFELYNATQE